MGKSMSHQKNAVKSGYWPLYRFHPSDAESGQPFKLDSTAPSMPISEFVAGETRFAILARTQPERAAELAQLAQADVDERWRYYEQLAAMHRSVPHLPPMQPGNQAELTPGADSVTTIAGGTPDDVTAEPMMADSAAGEKGDVE
jgi:pyruvate-ferredoxin/flavodoxin oxidoreductase